MCLSMLKSLNNNHKFGLKHFFLLSKNSYKIKTLFMLSDKEYISLNFYSIKKRGSKELGGL